MVTARVDSDLVRLRQFLRSLETDAGIAVGDIDLREIETLKREIEDIESFVKHGSKSFLFRIEIDYGAPQRAFQSASMRA